eukprot:357002-Chlamydomonas_euryale.AAC.2
MDPINRTMGPKPRAQTQAKDARPWSPFCRLCTAYKAHTCAPVRPALGRTRFPCRRGRRGACRPGRSRRGGPGG